MKCKELEVVDENQRDAEHQQQQTGGSDAVRTDDLGVDAGSPLIHFRANLYVEYEARADSISQIISYLNHSLE